MQTLDVGARRHLWMATLLCAVVVSGCSNDSGINSSSNRGAGSEIEDTTVENAYLVPRSLPGSCAMQVGDSAMLSFTATNTRSEEAERLLNIDVESADGARILPSEQMEIPPKSSIAATQPIEQDADAKSDNTFRVVVDGLDPAVRPGMNIPITFEFQNAGDIAMAVPVEACPKESADR